MGEMGDFWREKRLHDQQRKEEKKQKAAMTKKPKGSWRCRDWLVLMNGPSYARNGSSFKTYRKVKGTAMGMKVLGIGSVELKCVASPDEPETTTTLLIENVLHIPSALCNGFSIVGFAGNVTTATSTPLATWQGHTWDGTNLFYAEEFLGLSKLVLSGSPAGISPLKGLPEGTPKFMSLWLSKEEEQQLFA